MARLTQHIGAAMPQLELQVNRRALSLPVDATSLLVDVLRGPLALTGTQVGCDTSQCGACTVLLDGVAVRSCSILALQAQGGAVTTIEGLAPEGGLHALQEAFMAEHGLQCGFCTPGMLMSAAALLAVHPEPTEAQIVQALEGNLCRCTGYVNIVKAVQRAARAGAQRSQP
jgi:aerobic carbon-monoxide dehydrogenase small subunit